METSLGAGPRAFGAGVNGVAILIHGFTRRGHHLSALAARLRDRGIGTVAPDLGSFNWFRSTNNPRYLDRIAARLDDMVTGPLVLIGHSAGAAAAGHLATRLRGVRGVVYVDGNESPTRLLARAWPSLGTVPMVAICAPPQRCNRGGQFAHWAQQHGIPGCVIPGMGHGDIEGAERGLYRLVCGSAGTEQTRELLMATVVQAAEGMLRTGRVPDFPAGCDPW